MRWRRLLLGAVLGAEACLAARPVADDGVEVHELAVAPDLEPRVLPHRQRADGVDEMVLVADRQTVDLEDDVVGLETGEGGGGVGIYRLDESTLYPIESELDGVCRFEGGS